MNAVDVAFREWISHPEVSYADIARHMLAGADTEQDGR
jgi:hypothetical protein